ncbi:MAG: uracil-DNA glycosylase family protein [Candidatus Amulumruptor caecigallinarius]|nr:uracil-DNA glycosylase family protein [Candidatus Amulumruptor caecigallinarius]MCM1397322.1 uracil-DNA glycosylase family protein [Candidatus Amulumruptor caecigallinarius]MCM1453614.1 uracil-DNA glycosylase family protein [bacterium]
MDTDTSLPLERHPFPPFLPPHAKVLIMGTFPPKPHRWSMEFYYPNVINDFWRVMGLIFFDDKDALWDAANRKFREADLRRLLTDKGIALHDTGAVVRRLRDNASDKFLEIIEPVDLAALLRQMPECHTIATTGEKAAGIIANLTDSPLPKMGQWVTGHINLTAHPRTQDNTSRTQDNTPRTLDITRMPSTSRAYPLPLVQKAAYYRQLLQHAHILP